MTSAMNPATTAAPRRAFSIELVLVVGLPLLTVVAGALMLALAFNHGFTPVPAASAPAAHHGG